MKKYLLSLFLFFVCAGSLMAQFSVYHPFPDSNAYWYNSGSHECTYGNYGAYFSSICELRGDTMVNGRVYQRVSLSVWDQCYGEFPLAQYTATEKCIREDTAKRIYECCSPRSNDSTDYLLYDFSVKLGAVLPPNSLDEGGSDTVVKIDSILIGTSYRKQFTVNYRNWDGVMELDSIVEGMGSWNGLLGPIGAYEFGDEKLNCFKHYPDSTGDCINYLGIAVLTGQQVKFTIYPNPASNQVTLSYQLSTSQKTGTLQLYNAVGQLIKSSTINEAQGTEVENVSALPNGIYYYTLSVNGMIEATNKLVIIH